MPSSRSMWPLQYVAGCSRETGTSLYPAHQRLADVPLCFSYHYNNFLIFLLDVVGFPLFKDSPCHPSPFPGTSYVPVSPPVTRAVLSTQRQAAAPCPSACVFADSCVRHCAMPCFWGCVLSTIPYSLPLPWDGKTGRGLGVWLFLRYVCGMAPSLANWVDGGEARCLFSLHECLEPRNTLQWVSPVIPSSARHLGSPISVHHLKPTQNWLDLGRWSSLASVTKESCVSLSTEKLGKVFSVNTALEVCPVW